MKLVIESRHTFFISTAIRAEYAMPCSRGRAREKIQNEIYISHSRVAIKCTAFLLSLCLFLIYEQQYKVSHQFFRRSYYLTVLGYSMVQFMWWLMMLIKIRINELIDEKYRISLWELHFEWCISIHKWDVFGPHFDRQNEIISFLHSFPHIYCVLAVKKDECSCCWLISQSDCTISWKRVNVCRTIGHIKSARPTHVKMIISFQIGRVHGEKARHLLNIPAYIVSQMTICYFRVHSSILERIFCHFLALSFLCEMNL
jgi:hypothetical protein